MKVGFWGSVATVSVALATTAVQADSASQEASNRLAREIYAQLIEINTTDSVGNVTDGGRSDGASASARPAFPPLTCGCWVRARIRRTSWCACAVPAEHKPVLLIGHLDVVEARREDWTHGSRSSSWRRTVTSTAVAPST